MIQFVKYQNIDFVKWDKCIEKSINYDWKITARDIEEIYRIIV